MHLTLTMEKPMDDQVKTAIESQDVDGQIAAQEQIANLTMDAARLNAMKVAEESKPKEVNVTPQQTRQSAQTDPMAEAWASDNPWFGNDSAMTYTEFDIHKQLVEKEGYDPKSKEFDSKFNSTDTVYSLQKVE